MSTDNALAAMGLVCFDCSYFERESEDGFGVCLTSGTFEKVHGQNGVCSAFTQRGCETDIEKDAIANLRKQYIQKGVKAWRNPFAK